MSWAFTNIKQHVLSHMCCPSGKKRKKSCVVGESGDVVVEGCCLFLFKDAGNVRVSMPVCLLFEFVVFVLYAPGASRCFFFCTWRLKFFLFLHLAPQGV